jgi:hypothetical protein
MDQNHLCCQLPHRAYVAETTDSTLMRSIRSGRGVVRRSCHQKTTLRTTDADRREPFETALSRPRPGNPGRGPRHKDTPRGQSRPARARSQTPRRRRSPLIVTDQVGKLKRSAPARASRSGATAPSRSVTSGSATARDTLGPSNNSASSGRVNQSEPRLGLSRTPLADAAESQTRPQSEQQTGPRGRHHGRG